MRSRRRSTTVSRAISPSNTQTPPTCMCTGPRSAEIAETSEGERGSATAGRPYRYAATGILPGCAWP